MKLPAFLRRSLKARVTLFTLVIFVLGMVLVTLWTGHMQRDDVQAMLELQQVSTAAILANEVDHELADRKRSITRAAQGINAQLMADTTALRQHLQARPELLAMFNDGIFITSSDATAVVAEPMSSHRVGVNYLAVESVGLALRSGKTTIGKEVVGQADKQVRLFVAAPIHNSNSQIIGALVGATDLGKSNFLDSVLGRRYGKSGGVMLVDRADRQIVSGGLKSPALQALPAPGVDSLTDKFVAGFEGVGLASNAQDDKVLIAAQAVPTANWFLAVHQPMAEVFSPIDALQQRMWLAIAILTVLATALTWWMLQCQLQPMVHTAASLVAVSSSSAFPQQLPVVYHDEIGSVIGGFNQLLQTLQQHEKTLKDSEERFRTLAEWTHEALVVHCCDRVLYVNPAAVRMFGATSANALLAHSVFRLLPPEELQVTFEPHQLGAPGAAKPLHEQRFRRLDGSMLDVEVSAIPIQFDGLPAMLSAAHDISERKRTELVLQASLRDKVALLNEVHHRVKNNLQVITSMLRLESGRSTEQATRAVLQDMQGRIRTMALLHETLYQTGVFASVDLAQYLKQIATQTVRAQSLGSVQLQLTLQALQVSMDLAAPCGLMVNELISNALKHAFQNVREAQVTVSLQLANSATASEPTWCLRVSDNGVGLSPDFEERCAHSLGMQLVGDLARQLGSVLEIQATTQNSTGADFSVLFIPNPSTR